MELKELNRVPYEGDLTLLTNGPRRRLKRSLEWLRKLGKIEQLGRSDYAAKELKESTERQLKENRKPLLGFVKQLADRGIFGIQVDSEERPMVIWWYQSLTWKVTNVRRLARGRHYRSSEAGRQAVSFTWQGLTEQELSRIQAVLDPERFDSVSVSIKKKDFQEATGAKRPPVGTAVGRETWSIEPVPLWEED